MKKLDLSKVEKYFSLVYVVVFLLIYMMSFVVKIESKNILITDFEIKVFFVTFIVCLIRTSLTFIGKKETKKVEYIDRRNADE